MLENPLILFMGPTATQKTDIAIELTKEFPLEIVSVDSMLIYKEMDIGTAKPSIDLLKTVPHHLIDIISPIENYSVARFLNDAETAIKRIQLHGKIPFLVGGTMLYFKAFVDGLANIPKVPKEVRENLKEELATEGLAKCYERLQAVDSVTAARLHPHDTQRILRALEVFDASEKPLSVWIKEEQHQVKLHSILSLSLLPQNRLLLHEALAKRFHKMLQKGFVEEVRMLQTKYQLNADSSSMRSVGYRQVFQYLTGEYSYETMIEKGIIASRQLAKRQMTWLRAWQNPTVVFAYQPDTMSQIKNHLSSFLAYAKSNYLSS